MNLAKIDLIQNIFFATGLVCMPNFITTAALNQESRSGPKKEGARICHTKKVASFFKLLKHF